ncbi:MAG TPA: patatin-like phospholipase family protein [Stellaceae bacterium]|nr:patatin-like phospholipase family protein [Stellaceae bacterium]
MPAKKEHICGASQFKGSPHGQITLVLQGGGALGAYQAGCYQAMTEAGFEPHWVIGTSIGAMNAAIIAGNPPDQRLAKLRELWRCLEYGVPVKAASAFPMFGGQLATWMTMMAGLDNFFTPNVAAFTSPYMPLGSDGAGYYSTERLKRTMTDLIDFGRVNELEIRLTVGAANVRTGEMRYFDSRDEPLSLSHVLASGALPPAFPAVRVDGELYWDGGILSNTPVEAVFDDMDRRSGLIFAVHMWNPRGAEPGTIAEVMSRQKDLQYASRARSQIRRQQELHRLRHVIAELAQQLPAETLDSDRGRLLAAHGCLTKMHIVRLLAPSVGANDHSKDIDFSPSSIEARWEAGYRNTSEVIQRAPWLGPSDPLDGFVLHEFDAEQAA